MPEMASDLSGARATTDYLPASLGRLRVSMAAVLTAMALLVSIDVFIDIEDGEREHVVLDLLIGGIALGGIAGIVRMNRRASALQGRLRVVEGEAARFRDESRAYLSGLSLAIDRQLTRWALSPAEREVVLLLLKGLSHKEIATVRSCSERTVRHQARVAYRKAGLAGRVELAAFFLEDLLAPPSQDEATRPERTAG